MKYSFLLVCFLLLIQSLAFPQEKRITENGKTYVMHRVEKGETIFSLSKAYEIDQKELLNANPNLIFGLKDGQELRIPIREIKIAASAHQEQPAGQEPLPSFQSYKVKRKNTLHFIAKRFNITIDDILKYNPEAKNGLRNGQILLIPNVVELAQIKNQQEQPESGEIIHWVVGDETLYSISKKYECTISSILELNPEVQKGLKIGMSLRIPKEKNREEKEITSVAKDGFFVHLVESGETFWQLERRFGTPRSELEEFNPVLKSGLKAGLRINIPSRHIPDVHSVLLDGSQYEKHLVKRGETLYGLAILYKTNISDLKKANPVLNYRGLIAGETIFVTRQDEQPILKLDSINSPVVDVINQEKFTKPIIEGCTSDFMATYTNFKVGLLLPFYLAANDTVNHIHISAAEIAQDTLLQDRFVEIAEMGKDTFIWRDEKIIYPRSENFMQFYEGVLLAVDSLQRAGMNIELHVFDTNQDQQVIDSLIQLDVFRNLDLIIGPVFPNLQKTVADYAFKNRIPMVSPLSSGGNFETTNPYYFKVNPNKDYLIRETANYLGENYFDKNLIVMQMGEYKHLPEAELVNLSREKFFSTGFNNYTGEVLFHEYDFSSEGYWGLSRIVSRNRENVFIIPSATEAQISVAVTNLNALSEDYPVSLMGLSNFQHYQSIQTEYYHHVKLQLLSPYFVDYQSSIANCFIQRFRDQFYAEPNQFSFQGYDVAFYFMEALFHYGKNFINCLPGHHAELTQGNFYFEKQSRFGGYMNQGLFIVSYNSDYTISDKKIFVQPNIELAGE